MSQTNPNTGATHIEAALPFELISPLGGEIKVMMVCEPSQGGGAAVGMSPKAARDFWDTHVKAAHWFDPDKECLVILCLDAKNRVKAWNLVSLGTLEASLSHPREVFRPAIVAAANGIILMHNHPSGDPKPSLADHAVTEQLVKAARIVDIPLHDHVIVGDTSNDRYRFGYFSFREHLWDTIRDQKPVSWEKSPAMAQAGRARVPTEGRAQGQKTKNGGRK
jgi:DNA repair protein RadC